jgi:hypothetical protein
VQQSVPTTSYITVEFGAAADTQSWGLWTRDRRREKQIPRFARDDDVEGDDLMARWYRIVGWGYAVVCASLLGIDRQMDKRVIAEPIRQPAPAPRVQVAPAPRAIDRSDPADAAEWFRKIKPYCNSVEIATVQRDMPPPATVHGSGYHAACLALAGRIDDARRVIDLLGDSERQTAAHIVFDIGHPVADAGDDRSAGPIMELVVDYVPTHYMALYHAGMSEYMLGQRDLAKRSLTAFLRYYSPRDGWRTNAEDVLKRLADPNAADLRRPREP